MMPASDRSRARGMLVLVGLLACACTHRARPTVTGAELYARLEPLRAAGQTTIGSVTIRTSQVLSTGSGGQTFVIAQLIDKCHGGDPGTDVDCALALVLGQRFTVLERMPQGHAPKLEPEDQSSPIVTAVAVIGLGVAAITASIYGIATCDFPGCKVVFGAPLVLVGGAALFMVGRD